MAQSEKQNKSRKLKRR